MMIEVVKAPLASILPFRGAYLQEVNACLTTIAVASSHRRMGLAARLVTSLEDFFRARGVSHYWLDTITENAGARSFYQKQGFIEVATHGKTVVFLKQLRLD